MNAPDIAASLRLFDRKERHLVVQACLGEAANTLSKSFRDNLSRLLQSRLLAPLRSDAWWTTDYHLEWLIGALAWHAEYKQEDRERSRRNKADLIRGNQEDIDLVVASGSDVILVEAKGHLSWGNSQLTSKLQRLTTLCDAQNGVVEGNRKAPPVKLHFVLMSVRKPAKLTYTIWPEWALTKGESYWMPMRATDDSIRVGRCDDSGRSTANGGYWRMWRDVSHSPP